MIKPERDNRSARRRARDEQIAAEPQLPRPDMPDARTSPVESHMSSRRQPMAVTGVVENGMVRPLDPNVKLPEHARVIIVAAEGK